MPYRRGYPWGVGGRFWVLLYRGYSIYRGEYYLCYSLYNCFKYIPYMSFSNYQRNLRQKRYNKEYIARCRAEGRCLQCKNPIARTSKSLCIKHQELRRKDSRDVYRILHGIPVDAPLRTGGRNPITDWSLIDWKKPDAQISKEVGCSREAVRLQRKKIININSNDTGEHHNPNETGSV